MPRIKKTVIQAPQKAALPTIMKEVAFSQSALKRIEADLEKRIIELRKKREEEIQRHKEIIKENTDLLQAYIAENSEQFEKKRSMDLTHGTIGLRTNPPKVEFHRGFKNKALGLVKAMGLEFVRTKEELDKDKIIASREDKEIMGKLDTCGIKVVQKTNFFCEPKEESIELV